MDCTCIYCGKTEHDQLILWNVCLNCQKLPNVPMLGKALPKALIENIDRIQISRQAKWPPHTLRIDRCGPFGNPIRVDAKIAGMYSPRFYDLNSTAEPIIVPTNEEAVRMFKIWWYKPAQQPLRAKFLETVKKKEVRHLGCWCSKSETCHGDVLVQYLLGVAVVERPPLTEEAIRVLEQVFPAVRDR